MKNLVWGDGLDERLIPITKTARLHNIELEFICKGMKFEQDYFFKLSSLYKKVCELGDNEIVCCTDGFDVLYQDNAESMRGKFLSFACDVVYSAEKVYAHQYPHHKKYYESLTKSRYKYLNSGGVVGYAKALREMLNPENFRKKPSQVVYNKLLPFGKRVLKTEFLRKAFLWMHPRRFFNTKIGGGNFNDQAAVGDYVATYRGGLKIKLDYNCQLFWCISGECKDFDKHFEVVNKRIVNKNTGTVPSCIHVPCLRENKDVFLKVYDLIVENGI